MTSSVEEAPGVVAAPNGTVPPGATRRGRPPRRLHHVPALDGLRGLAVLLVVVFHSSLLAPSVFLGGTLADPHNTVFAAGELGVDAFFVLSGFLITALLLGDGQRYGGVRFRRFYLRRALRLLPALAVFLLADLVYGRIVGAPLGDHLHGLASVLFYVNNTWLAVGNVAGTTGHLWSLAVEEQFYLVWPALFSLLVPFRRSWPVVVAVTLALVAAAAAWRYSLWVDLPRSGSRRTKVPHIYSAALTRADALLLGSLAAQLWVRRLVPRWIWVPAVPAGAWFLWLAHRGADEGFLSKGGYTLVAGALALVVLAIVRTGWWPNRVLELAPLRGLGRISYAVYIWHLWIFFLIIDHAPEWSSEVRWAVGWGGTLVVALASWYLVERPALGLKDRLDARAGSAGGRPRQDSNLRPRD